MWRKIHSAKKDGRESQCDEVTTRRGVVPRAHATFYLARGKSLQLASGIFLLVTPLASDMVEEGKDLGDLDQWRSQDIAVARAQHGHTTFVRTSSRSAEAYRGVWGNPPPKNLGILQLPRSVLRPYTVAKCKSLTANSRMMSV